jgi:thymidylate synthase
MEIKAEYLNQALILVSKSVLENGVPRATRGFNCVEFQEPVTIKITNPTDRYINIPERKWPKTLPFAEALWLASGTNHMDLVGDYAPNMYNFSDNQVEMRAAYGPRIRAFSGFSTDYKVHHPNERNIISGYVKTVDQLKFVIQSLQRDINSRQALITIHDPVKDDYDDNNLLKVTKDTPCCRSLQFLVNNGKLDCILTIRSNDILWGFSAVNVFNFHESNCLRQELCQLYHKCCHQEAI